MIAFLVGNKTNEHATYRGVNFRVLAVFLLHLLHPLLLPLPLLLVQTLQVLPPLVLLQHLVALELLVPLGVIILQVLGGLTKTQKLPHLNSLRAST